VQALQMSDLHAEWCIHLQISIVKRLREDIAPPRGYGGRGGYDRYDRGGGGYGR